MAKSCAIIPRVVNKNGEKTESRLFKDLLSFTNNRKETVRIYQITKNESFQRDWFPKLKLDEYNEPLLSSLLDQTNLRDYIPESNIIKQLNKLLGKFDKNGNVKQHQLSDSTRKSLVEKAIDFNNNSEYNNKYVAIVTKGINSNTHKEYLTISIHPKNEMYNKDAKDMEYNESLNNKLIQILNSKGISVGALTDIERRLGINGVTDFNLAKSTADGLIELIRLSDNIEGQKALPEEFSHFVVESMENQPMMQRLISMIITSNLTETILGKDYDIYSKEYNDDNIKLAKEAAGKLISKQMIKNESVTEVPSNFMSRVVKAVKEFFRSFSLNEIQKAMIDAEKAYGNFAKDLLNGFYDEQLSLKNISGSEKYFNLSERVSRDKKLVSDIIKNETKKLDIYKSRNPGSKFETTQQLFLDRLETFLIDNEEIEAIYTYLDEALKIMGQLDSKLKATIGGSESIKDKAKTLRDIRNYLFSYSDMNDSIRDALLDEEVFADNRYGARVRVAVDNLENLIKDMKSNYNKVAMPLFADFLKPYVGNSIEIATKDGRKKVPIQDLIKESDKDISIFNRWLDSMAESSDPMLKILDKTIKVTKDKARLRTIDVSKEIDRATIKLEEAGIKNTDFMFEYDSNGNRTDNYISPINYGQYELDLANEKKRLKEIYGEKPVGLEEKKYQKDIFNWIKAHTEYSKSEKLYKPKSSLYRNEKFFKLKPAEKEYYDTIMGIKEQLDMMLPPNATNKLNTIKIRKDLIERVKSSDSIKSGAKQISEAIKDSFIRRSDDIEIGNKATVADFEGYSVNTLPIYYTKLKDNESNNDISTDIASTLTAYASMAIDYDEMSKVIDVMEVGRDLLRQRDITQTQGGKPLVEKTKALGRKIESKITRSGNETRFVQRMNDFFDMQIYGRYIKDEGTVLGLDVAKTADMINTVTSLNSLALNVLSGISNVATGTVMMNIESVAGEFFTAKNTITADKNYTVAMKDFMGDIGSRVKTSKLYLFDELFNVLQDYETEIRNKEFDRKTRVGRLASTSSLFLINNAGEHWMQNRTALALADAYKLKDANGKEISLWDALEVVPIGEHIRHGAKIQLKQGVTKLDGSDFTQADITAFANKSKAINQRMHGIYNKLDKNAFQKVALGRLAMMFRKWIRPSLNRRFSSENYNYDLEAWSEGYYTTVYKFGKQLYKDLRASKFDLMGRWNQLDNRDKANFKRAFTEVGTFLALSLMLAVIDWPDDKDRPWVVKMAEYQSRRLYTELGVLTPGLHMLDEGLRILESPAAGISIVDNLMNTMAIMNPWAWQTELQSGRYKGHSKAYKALFESPLLPMNKTVYKALHPETGIAFFAQ